MTAGEYETGEYASKSKRLDRLKLAAIPKSLLKPYRQSISDKTSLKIALTPSASCIRQLYHSKYPDWKDDG